jgi:hypothetical protein
VVKKGGELLLSEAVKGGGGLLGSTFVDRNWEKYFAGEVRGRRSSGTLGSGWPCCMHAAAAAALYGTHGLPRHLACRLGLAIHAPGSILPLLPAAQVGHSAFRAWRDAAPQDWLECKGKWEVEKRLWDPEQSPTSYVPIPVSLYDCISAEDKAVVRCVGSGWWGDQVGMDGWHSLIVCPRAVLAPRAGCSTAGTTTACSTSPRRWRASSSRCCRAWWTWPGAALAGRRLAAAFFRRLLLPGRLVDTD